MFTYKNVIYINVHFHWANLKAKFSYHTQNLIFKLVIKKVLSAECTLIFIISNKRRWKVALLIQFMPQVSFYIPLKTSENFWFSDIFRGYRKRPLPWNGLIVCQGFWKNFFLWNSNLTMNERTRNKTSTDNKRLSPNFAFIIKQI